MNRKALINATVVGTILQLAMIVAGHFIPFVKDNVFMLGGMAISLAAGLLYARAAKGAWPDSLLGGGIAGLVCAVIGIAASVLLGDTDPAILLFGTLSSAVTGLIGGAIGKLLK
jgi:heme O synthase-like polyprenyltransferase